MRRIIVTAVLLGLIAVSGCAGGDYLYNLFGFRNSDQADLKKINQGNQFSTIPD